MNHQIASTATLLGLAVAGAVRAEPALTIYNQNFAVVRETVPLDLKAGANPVRFSGMTALLEPDSVILRDPAKKVALRVLEQSYRNDPVSQDLLLSMFEGKTVTFLVREPNKPDREVTGKVIRSGYKSGSAPVIEVDGRIHFGLPGQPVFPSLGDDTVLNPTLTWTLDAPRDAKFDAELAYVTGGLSWQASYNLVSPEKGDRIDLVGWVTMNNESGRTFEGARIKLLAGDVHKLQPATAPPGLARARAMMMQEAKDQPVVTEKAFDDFHLYTLARPATLRDRETKQVEFVRAAEVASERLYVYDGAELPGWRVGFAYGPSDGYGAAGTKKVRIYREFKNSKENGLGIPLPKGRVRFYRQDDDRRLEFTGENELDHTPKDEMVRLYTGDAFDLVGERKRLDFRVNNANNWADESFEIKVRNRKSEPVEVRVVEHLFRWLNWEVREKSRAFEKKDAQTIEFRVPLAPDEEQVVTYKVHYTW